MQPLHGNHLIAGEKVAGKRTFVAAKSAALRLVSEGNADLITMACARARESFDKFGRTTRLERAGLLRAIAHEIELHREIIVSTAAQESALSIERLHGETTRTTRQLGLFADHIEKGDYLDIAHDMPRSDNSPLPRPDLRRMQ